MDLYGLKIRNFYVTSLIWGLCRKGLRAVRECGVWWWRQTSIRCGSAVRTRITRTGGGDKGDKRGESFRTVVNCEESESLPLPLPSPPPPLRDVYNLKNVNNGNEPGRKTKSYICAAPLKSIYRLRRPVRPSAAITSETTAPRPRRHLHRHLRAQSRAAARRGSSNKYIHRTQGRWRQRCNGCRTRRDATAAIFPFSKYTSKKNLRRSLNYYSPPPIVLSIHNNLNTNRVLASG